MLAARRSVLRALDQLPLVAEQANEVAIPMDLNDARRLQHALEGASAVVHFAGYPREADWAVLLAANVAAVTTLWEAARMRGADPVAEYSRAALTPEPNMPIGDFVRAETAPSIVTDGKSTP